MAILTVVPFEHWCLGTLSLVDEAVELRLDGGLLSEERSKFIQGHLKALTSSSSHKGLLKLSVQVLAALRFQKLETELANIPTEEVDRRRKSAEACLDKVKATGKVEEEVFRKMVLEYKRKKQESDKAIQIAQQRVDSLVHVHDAKVMLA
ncbi:hypothetical protein NW762_014755 [Fusarium torreyae]|uniref:Uncharacterized protein n=1 Tax=Fusarium torreyae TaxID=1237075 RepID=A0A9W8RLP3_9HYPO|nr:hypothetical protein NW762_014755 [Fusarium torreyae]